MQTTREIGDGTVRRLGQGDILIAEDPTGQGHARRDVGPEARVSVFVPIVDLHHDGASRETRRRHSDAGAVGRKRHGEDLTGQGHATREVGPQAARRANGG
jgi:hypothetical protein